MQHAAVTSGAGRRRPRSGPSATALVALLGCAGMLAASGLIAWITWTFLQVYAAVLDDVHIVWVIGASLFFVLGLSTLWGTFTRRSDKQLIQRALAGKPPIRGARNAFIGTIQSVHEPLEAPVTGTRCVYFDYTIDGRDPGESDDRTFYSGTRMNGPIVSTPHGAVKLLGKPDPRGFTAETTSDGNAIREFVDSRKFEKDPRENLKATFDDDGIIRRDFQWGETPRNWSGLVLETDLIHEGAAVWAIGTWNREGNSLGAFGPIHIEEASDTRRLRGAKAETGPGCTLLLGLLFLVASGTILGAPLVPGEYLSKIPGVGHILFKLRADRVSSYIDERRYDEARRLSGLGLGGWPVSSLSQLGGELELAGILLANGAEPDSADSFGHTLLMRTRDPLLVERLLRAGAMKERTNHEQLNAGQQALARWDHAAATRLIDPEGPGEAVAKTIRAGHVDAMREELDAGTDPDAVILLHDRELSPLYYAAAWGNLDAVNLLLERGASLDLNNIPPLQGAVEMRSVEIVRRLVDAGASVEYSGHTATDPLFAAIQLGSVEMTELLVELGAGRDPVYQNLLTYTSNDRIKEIVSRQSVAPV